MTIRLPLPTGGAFVGTFPPTATSGDLKMIGATVTALADLWAHAEIQQPVIPALPHLETVLPFGQPAGGEGV